MIIVMEKWFLKEDEVGAALEVMQQMDELVGPAAHQDPGWCGHARFYQAQHNPAEITMIYPWRSREMHEQLRDSEEGLLAPFYSTYCRRPREIIYYTELPVDVHHDES